jgi:glycosyltransferase involved in cell wall biosynthesis
MAVAKPLVSVILPVHRDDHFTKLSIESVLNQGFKDLEIIVLKTDNLELDKSIAESSRVRILSTPSNWNLSQKLNMGIDKAEGKYIARMDSDDISHADRIAKQVLFMDQNPSIGILGTGIKFIGNLPGNEDLINKVALLPSGNRELLLHMLNKNPFFHPTVMFRADSLKESGLKYRKSYNRSQDYNLWTRSAGKLEFANLQEPLLDYRLHGFQSGYLGALDSNYFSNIAKLFYCIKCIMSFDYRSISAMRILPHRICQLLKSWLHRHTEY